MARPATRSFTISLNMTPQSICCIALINHKVFYCLAATIKTSLARLLYLPLCTNPAHDASKTSPIFMHHHNTNCSTWARLAAHSIQKLQQLPNQPTRRNQINAKKCNRDAASTLSFWQPHVSLHGSTSRAQAYIGQTTTCRCKHTDGLMQPNTFQARCLSS